MNNEQKGVRVMVDTGAIWQKYEKQGLEKCMLETKVLAIISFMSQVNRDQDNISPEGKFASSIMCRC